MLGAAEWPFPPPNRERSTLINDVWPLLRSRTKTSQYGCRSSFVTRLFASLRNTATEPLWLNAAACDSPAPVTLVNGDRETSVAASTCGDAKNKLPTNAATIPPGRRKHTTLFIGDKKRCVLS